MTEPVPALDVPLTDDQVRRLIDDVTKIGRERRQLLGLEQAHNITFAAGAMAVFATLGLWGQVPMAWHIAMLRQNDPFTGEMYPDADGESRDDSQHTEAD